MYAATLSMIQSREIIWHSSGNLNTRQHRKKIKSLQNNVALFGQLFISMQSREGDLTEFFALLLTQTLASFIFQLQSLLQCIEHPGQSVFVDLRLQGHGWCFRRPLPAHYKRQFLSRVCRQDFHTIDGEATTDCHTIGCCVWRPGNWMDFLRDPDNKEELFSFLTVNVEEFPWPPAKAVYVTSGQFVSSIGTSFSMENCNHEEADTRIEVRGSCTTCTAAWRQDYPSTYSGYRCRGHPYRHIPWSNRHSTLGRHLDGIWQGHDL